MSPAPWSMSWEPLFIVLGVLAAIAYVRAWRRSDPRPSRRRAWAFGVGIALVVVSLNSPMETIAVEYLLIFHLLQNVIIADWAPPLLIIGLAPAMRAAIASRLGRPFAIVTRPQIALPVWLVGWYVIHLGGVYDFALRNPVLLNLEHLFMIAIGLVFWWPIISDAPAAAGTLVRIAYVFSGFVLSAFLGLALTFAPSFYDYYATRPERLWSISADADQNLGGILMTSEQAIVLFAAIVWLLMKLFREEDEAEARLRAEQRSLVTAVESGEPPAAEPDAR
ncbi:MAG: cytochrome c oxidase assembly protein [Actinobacteria bacterium]|nr:cytochrome c oxidase assembly protein [Actinomycetota bacterium]